MYPQNIAVRLKFSVQDICKLWSHYIAVITSTTYMTVVELFDEYFGPFSPEVIRSLIMTRTSILNDIILSMETERSTKACIYTRSKQFSPKSKKDLGMAYHISPLKKMKKQGEMPLPSLGPIPLKNVEFRETVGVLHALKTRIRSCLPPRW